MEPDTTNTNGAYEYLRSHKKLIILFLLFIAAVATYWFVMNQTKIDVADVASAPAQSDETGQYIEPPATASDEAVASLSADLEAIPPATNEQADQLLQQLQ